MNLKKHFRYLRYILKHKWYVAIQCFRNGLILRAFTHDLSKFRPSEWFAYVDYFYGNSKKTDNFDFAWFLHQKRNKHHWQWWVLLKDNGRVKTLPMGKSDVLEMLCDWWGASMAQGIGGWDSVFTWYKNNKWKMQFHPNTIEEIEWFFKGEVL